MLGKRKERLEEVGIEALVTQTEVSINGTYMLNLRPLPLEVASWITPYGVYHKGKTSFLVELCKKVSQRRILFRSYI